MRVRHASVCPRAPLPSSMVLQLRQTWVKPFSMKSSLLRRMRHTVLVPVAAAGLPCCCFSSSDIIRTNCRVPLLHLGPISKEPTNSIEHFSVPATMSSNTTTCPSPGHAFVGAYDRLGGPPIESREVSFASLAFDLVLLLALITSLVKDFLTELHSVPAERLLLQSFVCRLPVLADPVL